MLLRVSQGSANSNRKLLAALLSVSILGPAALAEEENGGDKEKKTPAIQIKLSKAEKEAQSKELNDEIAGLLELAPEQAAKKDAAKAKPVETQTKQSKAGKSAATVAEKDSQPGDGKTVSKQGDPERGKPDVSGFVLIELSAPIEKSKPRNQTESSQSMEKKEADPAETKVAINPVVEQQSKNELSNPKLSTPALRSAKLPENVEHPSKIESATEQKAESANEADGQEVDSEQTPGMDSSNEKQAELGKQTDADSEPASLPSDPRSLLSLSKGSGEDPETCPGDPANAKPGEAHLPSQPEDLPVEESDNTAEIDAPVASKESRISNGQRTQSITLSDKVEAAKPEFSQRELVVERKIDACLNYFRTHPENTTRRGPWALMHATLPFGVETEIIAGNRKVNAIGWMCYNGVCAKQRVFQPTRRGFRLHVGPGVQGHEGQFLAVLAQSQVSAQNPIQIGRSRYTVTDLVKYEMATCREKSELTFKLIGLSHYLSPNQRWRDQRGRTWNLEKMVAEELAQPINGAACGGTHRLMGLSFALIKRQEAGLPVTGHWKRAETFINEFVNYTMTLQNPDGSFSTEWFKGRGYANDTKKKVQTTGHIVEWLIYTLPDEYLRSPQILSAVEYLLASVGENPSYDWPIGPRGHALRAMALYKQRVFEKKPLEMAASKSPVNR